jgi:hypothetical protein
MENMTHFNEYIKNCTDDELIALGKECSYARKYKNFDPDSKCERYMEEIIVGENYSRSSYIVRNEMISAVAYEIMERAIIDDDEPECEEKNRYYNVSFHLNYSDGRQGFGDCTMYVKGDQKMTPEFIGSQLDLIKEKSNAKSIVCISFSPYES